MLRAILEATLAQINLMHPVQWPVAAPSVPDADYSAATDAARTAQSHSYPVAPQAIIRQARTLGGITTIETARRLGGGDGKLRATFLNEDGMTESSAAFLIPELSAPRTYKVDMGLFLDATLELVVGDQVVDRVWISDGAWAPMDPELWEAQESKQQFSLSTCTARDFNRENTAAEYAINIQLSGCGQTIHRGQGAQAGLARHLTLRSISSAMVTSRFGLEVSLLSSSVWNRFWTGLCPYRCGTEWAMEPPPPLPISAFRWRDPTDLRN